MVAWLLEQLIDWISDRVMDILTFITEVLQEFVFIVPDVTALPQARQLWALNLTIVNTSYILAVVTAGIIAMTHDSVQVRYGIKELTPRLIFGAVAANFSLEWTRLILQVADSVLQAVTIQPLADTGALQVIRAQVAAALLSPDVALLSLAAAAVVTGLLAALVLQWMTRLAVLLICVIVAPLALACYCLPRLEAAAALWWRTLLGTLAVQLLQALILYGGMSVVVDPQAQLPSLLPFAGFAQSLNLFVLLVLLWTCVKIPSMMRRLVLRTGGGGGGGRTVAVLLVQQVTRGLAGRRSPARITQAAGTRA